MKHAAESTANPNRSAGHGPGNATFEQLRKDYAIDLAVRYKANGQRGGQHRGYVQLGQLLFAG